MSRIRYIREDLPRTKNTMHIRGHPLNPVEEIIVKIVNQLVQQANDDKTIPSNAPKKVKEDRVDKMKKSKELEDMIEKSKLKPDSTDNNNTNNEPD